MKPLYGTFKHVEWLRFDDYQNEWICHACGTRMGGSRIRPCKSCNSYPLWKYKDSIPSIAKTYIKAQTVVVITRLIGILMRLKNKIDNEGIGM